MQNLNKIQCYLQAIRQTASCFLPPASSRRNIIPALCCGRANPSSSAVRRCQNSIESCADRRHYLLSCPPMGTFHLPFASRGTAYATTRFPIQLMKEKGLSSLLGITPGKQEPPAWGTAGPQTCVCPLPQWGLCNKKMLHVNVEQKTENLHWLRKT